MMVLSGDDLFCLIWACSNEDDATWWVIDGDTLWERLRENGLVTICKMRTPLFSEDDRRRALYRITPQGRALLCEVETSRIVALCVERRLPRLLIPFIPQMERKDLPSLIVHTDRVIRGVAQKRHREICKREKRKRLVWKGAKPCKVGK